MTIALFLALYVKTVLTDFVLILNPDEPFVVKEFDILEEQYEDEAILRQGAWFQYLPLISTIQVQSIGILDSNCFHLFSSVGKYSQTLNMLYYDCQDHEQMTITKYIKFMGNDDQQYNFEISINVFEYENQWYYFEFILFPQENRFQILLIKNEEILKNDILNVLPLKDQRTILKIGGDLVVVDSKLLNIANGDKFASFPGKIKAIDLSGSVVDFVDSAIYLGEPWEKCTCVANPISSLINQDYVNLITSIYTSRFQNCDQFTFTGWFKINEIIQTHNVLTYQFIKLTSNVQNNLFQNQNISPLQLFYQLSKNLNTIIITTYSYTYPSITLDFTKDPFLITKEFQILNNMQLWHLLYVKLEREEFSVNLKFFENRQIYEYKTSIVVKQFHQIYFKLFLGNLQKSTNNYLNIISRNLYFFNCNKDFQQQNCHISCGECDGPTYQDCISCSIESKRIYFPEYKQCICPQDTVDHDDQCLGYPDFGFQLISGEEQNDECLYGQFELNGLCYQCPGQINSQITTCFECVQNPKDWYDNPFCNTFVYLNQDGRTTSLEQIYYQFAAKPYFIFNGVNLELCLECQQSSLTNQENINQDIAKKQELFNSFCLSKISGQQCSKCRIEYCTTCAIQQQDKSVFIVRNSRNQKMVSVPWFLQESQKKIIVYHRITYHQQWNAKNALLKIAFIVLNMWLMI
ncbi:unnamed protein product [Paramecium octaurelia]|uniref:Insulin-like growth factor binding protein, N-terminal n=1 Tax=Paramecium octaurelia TaxID=43137 RepID=A0A8S1WB71_PAROT|nr:unnamed protein product [Paramecium octaurelia]